MNIADQKRYLIIHADDGGYDIQKNNAIISLFKHQRITSCSGMVPAPHFRDFAEQMRARPQADIGVHITLTNAFRSLEWKPVLPSENVPSLVDDRGCFHSKADFSKHVQAVDIAREIRAQIKTFLASGLTPSHVDCHQGVVFQQDQFLIEYATIAREFGLRPFLLRWNKFSQSMIAAQNLSLPENIVRGITARGPVLDSLIMLPQDGAPQSQREATYRMLFKALPPGLSKVIIHPEMPADNHQQDDASAISRYADYTIFMHDNIHDFLNENDILPVSWGEFPIK
ncbi:ChbG/HpnK family deacetylase [candidate division KSB1 bacterium]|nr:ChbG/HpnK family deacetylase [candidate division KSB1 bacterium]